jgi:hypothetical protein
MSRWLIRIGVFFFVVGVLLLSPLTDLLPVNGTGPFSRPADPSLFRVVPTENEGNGGMALAIMGAALLGAGLLARRRSR